MAINKNFIVDAGLEVKTTATVNNNLTAGSLTVTGASNQVGAAVFSNTVNITGATTLSNLLTVAQINTTGFANVGFLNVVGNTAVGGTFRVAGAANAVSTLGVGGAATFNSTLAVNGAVTTNSTLNVAGNTVIGGTANITGNATFSSAVVIQGNLVVTGTTTTVNTQNLNVADNIITLNSDWTGAPTENAGIEINRGTSANVAIRWNETSDVWEVTQDGTNYGRVHSKLTDIVLGTDTSGAYIASATSSTPALTLSGTGGESATLTGAIRTANTTVDGIVKLTDSIANTSIGVAGSATAVKAAYDSAISYASNASNISSGTLAAARLATSGVTAGQYGSGSAVPVITVDDKGRVTALSTSAVAGVTGYLYTGANNTFTITTGTGSSFSANISSLTGTFGINITGNANNASNLNGQSASYYTDIAGRLGYTPVQQGGGTGQGSNKIYIGWAGSQIAVQVDSTNFGTTWPIGVSGNAATSTKLATARNISLTGDVTGNANFDGSSNISIAATVADDSHNHTVVEPKASQVPESARTVIDSGIYSFNTINASLGDSTPTSYWSTIAWGNGAAGSAELAADWTSNGNHLWYRSLRDTVDNWWPWKRIFTDEYHPNADTLTTARSINGTSFNGSADITTANWGTSRTITIGSTGKAVNGSGNVSWSLTEIGAPSTTGTGASGTWGISVTGNAATATTLQTARTINGTSFNGSANITTANWGTARTLTIGSTGKLVDGSGNVSWSLTEIGAPSVTGTGASGTWGISITGSSASTTGNAATATTLATARSINGTSFNGSADITTANWGTSRILTIGSTGKSVNGSGNVSWSLAEIGAPSTTGTGASGTWGINVTGYAQYVSRTVATDGFSILAEATIGGNDFFRIGAGGASNAGYAEIATADDGSEPIYVRQYTGTFTTLARSATLLDSSGNTSFPGTLSATQFNGSGAGLTGTASSLTAGAANSVAWTNVSGRPTAVSAFTNDSGYITTNGRAYPRRSDGSNINIIWSGQAGQPTWLIGGNDGTNLYAYNPSNFSVNYAASAGSVAWTNVSGRPTALSSFTNDSGFITNNVSGDISISGEVNLTGAGTKYVDHNGELNFRYSDNSTFFNQRFRVGGATNFCRVDGYLEVGGIAYASDFYISSDARLKNVTATEGNALSKVNAISGVYYSWNQRAVDLYGKNSDERHFGVLAQDVEAVLPEAVITREDGYKTVSYDTLVPLLIEAVKELTEKVARLEAR